MDEIKKMKSLGIFLGIIVLLVGVVFIVFSTEVAKVLTWVIGAGTMITGGIRIIQGAKKDPETQKIKLLQVILGIIMLGTGLYLVIDNGAATSLVGIVIAIFAFAAGFDRFVVASERRKQNLKIGTTVLFGFVHILFGILMIYTSLAMIALIVTITGIYMLVAGIMIIISAGYLFDLK